MTAPMCDFCPQAGGILTYYRTAPSRLTAIGPGGTRTALLSPGWRACPPCQRLIDANDRRGLLRRSLRKFGRRDRIAMVTLSAIQRAFFAAREGSAA